MSIIRKANMSDTSAMYELINKFAEEGKLLHRTLKSIYEHIQCFVVAEHEGQVIGTASLHILDTDLAEIRSLTVSPDYMGQGIGKKLVLAIINETKKLEVGTLLSLTYQVEFFQKCGFEQISQDELPMQKVWKDCLHCPSYQNCDENAMIIRV